MNITKYTLLIFLVILPFFFIHYGKDRTYVTAHQLQQQYKRVLETSIKDASESLLHFSEYQMDKDDEALEANRQEAMDNFFTSLYLQLGLIEKASEETTLTHGQAAIKNYIPAVLVIDYDGFYVYAMNAYEVAGEYYKRHTLMPKQYYSMTDGEGQIIQFHLDDYVEIFNPETGFYIEGKASELTAYSELLRQPNFDAIRKNYIIGRIEESLNYYINRHNTYAKEYGILYDFYLPRISYGEWENSIEDIGVMAFIQGIPIYYDTYLNLYGYQSSRILKKAVYYGYYVDGVAYYCREQCERYQGEVILETFDSRESAVKKGYYPCPVCQP